jgi:hypothetical protein
MSMSRPSMRGMANQSTNSGGVGQPSPASMSRQPASSISARRFSPRVTASMRWRVGVSRVSASSVRRRQALGQRPHGAQQGIQRVAQGLGVIQQPGVGPRYRPPAHAGCRFPGPGPTKRAPPPGSAPSARGAPSTMRRSQLSPGRRGRLQNPCSASLAARRPRPDPRPGASPRIRRLAADQPAAHSAASSPVRWPAKALSAASNR